jgi:RNA polymerase sigma-70 factor (ECF subfamily)
MTAFEAPAGWGIQARDDAAGADLGLTPVDVALSEDLEQVRAGDEQAFARVYRAVQPGLLRYLTVLVGRDAEDVASETWAQACRDLPRFRGDIDRFRGWVARIGRNRAIDHLRATARRPVSSSDVSELVLPDPSEGTEALVIESVSTRAAIAAIAALPRDQAEAVLLRVVVGLDAAGAAKVLGKRPGAVRTAAYRGLRTLAARIAVDGDSASATASKTANRNRAAGAGCDVSEPSDADEAR